MHIASKIVVSALLTLFSFISGMWSVSTSNRSQRKPELEVFAALNGARKNVEFCFTDQMHTHLSDRYKDFKDELPDIPYQWGEKPAKSAEETEEAEVKEAEVKKVELAYESAFAQKEDSKLIAFQIPLKNNQQRDDLIILKNKICEIFKGNIIEFELAWDAFDPALNSSPSHINVTVPTAKGTAALEILVGSHVLNSEQFSLKNATQDMVFGQYYWQSRSDATKPGTEVTATKPGTEVTIPLFNCSSGDLKAIQLTVSYKPEAYPIQSLIEIKNKIARQYEKDLKKINKGDMQKLSALADALLRNLRSDHDYMRTPYTEAYISLLFNEQCKAFGRRITSLKESKESEVSNLEKQQLRPRTIKKALPILAVTGLGAAAFYTAWQLHVHGKEMPTIEQVKTAGAWGFFGIFATGAVRWWQYLTSKINNLSEKIVEINRDFDTPIKVLEHKCKNLEKDGEGLAESCDAAMIQFHLVAEDMNLKDSK